MNEAVNLEQLAGIVVRLCMCYGINSRKVLLLESQNEATVRCFGLTGVRDRLHTQIGSG